MNAQPSFRSRLVRSSTPLLFLVLATTPRLFADTAVNQSGDLDFNKATIWTSGLPDSSTNASIASGSPGMPTVVNLDNSIANSRDLTVAASNTLNINRNSYFGFYGTLLSNSGAINLTGGIGTYSSLLLGAAGGNSVLSGGGTMTLNSNDLNGYARIYGGGQTLTIADQTIQGYGHIGDSDLALNNQGKGTLNANVSGRTLLLNGGAVTNAGVLEASNKGTLQIAVSVANKGGNLTADGGQVLIGNTATITGGTLNSLNGGTIGVLGGNTVILDGRSAGALVLHSDVKGTTWNSGLNTYTEVMGEIQNDGNLQVSGGTGTTSSLLLAGDTRLSGGGTVTLDSSDLNGYARIYGGATTLTNEDHTIQGYGHIGDSDIRLLNKATLTANVANQELLLNGGQVTNKGLLEATNKGVLRIVTSVANNGATIAADGGQVLVGNTATVTGGTLNTLNGGSMDVIAGNVVILDGRSAGAIVLHSDVKGTTWNTGRNTLTEVLGEIQNNGNLQVSGGTGTYAGLLLAADTTLSGGGTVTLDSSDLNGYARIYGGGTTLTNADHTLQGFGRIGDSDMKVLNQATLTANVAKQELLLNGGLVTNNGLLQATNNGVLRIETKVANSGGNITADGGQVLMGSGATITGGSLNSVNGGAMGAITGTTVVLDGRSAGALSLHSDAKGTTWNNGLNTLTELQGDLRNDGNIQVSGGKGTYSSLLLIGDTKLAGGGTVTLDSSDLSGYARIYGGGTTLTNVDQLIQGYGRIGDSDIALANMAKGTVAANVAGQTLTLNGGVVSNAGLLEATNGGVLEVSASLSNAGTVKVAGGSAGHFTSSTYQQTGGLTLVEAGGSLNALGVAATGGDLRVDGLLTASNITVGSFARLLGAGTVHSSVLNDGTVILGDSITAPSSLSLVGDYVQDSGAHLFESIGKGGNGLFDITGNLTLSGTLDIFLLADAELTTGELFTLCSFTGTGTGFFSSINALNANDWKLLYGANEIQLQYLGKDIGGGLVGVPEASGTLALLASSLFGLLGLRRRRA